jgi:hypothetical protein
LPAAQPASLTIIKINLIVALFIQTHSTVRTEKITDTALNTLVLVPHRLAVPPILIVMKIFGNEKFNHRTSFP